MNAYVEWIIDTNIQYLKDLKIALLIRDIQKILKKNKLLVSNIHYDHLVKIYNPTLIGKNIPIDMNDGFDLFNDAVLSSMTPYLVYNLEGKQYYKVYDHVAVDLNQIYDHNSLNYIMRKQGKNYDVVYNLNDNTLQLSYTHYRNTPNDKTIFTSLDIGEVVDYRMEGFFNIWQFEYNEEALLYYILTNSFINKILFVDDHKITYKKSISLKYIPLNTNTIINIEITQLFLTDDKVVDIKGADNIRLTKNKRKYIPYITVKFKNVYNEIAFINLITSLLNLFEVKNGDFNELLRQVDYKKEKDLDENLKKLKDLAPDAFIEGYANFCDVKKRPTPIALDEIEDYMNNKIKEYKLNKKEAKEYKEHAVLDFEVNDI